MIYSCKVALWIVFRRYCYINILLQSWGWILHTCETEVLMTNVIFFLTVCSVLICFVNFWRKQLYSSVVVPWYWEQYKRNSNLKIYLCGICQTFPVLLSWKEITRSIHFSPGVWVLITCCSWCFGLTLIIWSWVVAVQVIGQVMALKKGKRAERNMIMASCTGKGKTEE